ncbi:hypothetical protein Aspvir_006256 [Aspergillus viridinutans]|uniref:Uncharacterized protein n=1 Tax=Aspergillus viridinutans TaxID=75553 RepID=A0A9P3BX26_ASPVI|nr:uncharacterized protein Aspvir_006256 [Aspergillus viridinutans]GIK02208.1 hypothetical protein Aspvir_006256 [Aspergillus viridinutans]
MSKSRQAINDELDEIFSDKSSFYGTAILPEPGLNTNIHPYLLSTTKHESRAPKPVPDGDQAKHELSLDTDLLSEIPLTTLRRNARSPKESIHNFLAHLPPSTTEEKDVGPWIYITNLPRKADPDKQAIARLVREGTELLHRFEDQKVEHDRSRSKSKTALTRNEAIESVPLLMTEFSVDVSIESSSQSQHDERMSIWERTISLEHMA